MFSHIESFTDEYSDTIEMFCLKKNIKIIKIDEIIISEIILGEGSYGSVFTCLY